MSNNLTFAVDSKNIKIHEMNDSSFLNLEMYAISDESPNRNMSSFPVDGMISSIPTVYNKPVLGYFSNISKEFEEHNMDVKFDPDTGKLYEDFQGRDSEKSIGVIRESDTVEVVEHEGRMWLHITCGIWCKYNRQQVKNILRSKRKKVSVEVSVVKSHMDGQIEVIEEFVFNGITILGNTRGGFMPVDEGIKGAHLRLIEYINTERFNDSMRTLSFAAKADKFVGGIDSIYEKMFQSLNGDYSIDEIYMGGRVLLQELNSGQLFIAPYSLEGQDVIVDTDGCEEISDGFSQKLFISKDKIGKGPAITINFSKEAVSDDPWGSISKTDLRNKILAASNYRSLVGKAYLVKLDGWEDAPSANLKYPIAQIKSGKLVINRNALNAAFSFLQRNTNAPYYSAALRRLNSLKRIAGIEVPHDAKNVTEEKNVMKNKFVNVPKEFKYIRSSEGNAMFANGEKIFTLKCAAAEDEDVEFKLEELKEASLFIKDDKSDDGEENIDMTASFIKFISEEDEMRCAMEKKLADTEEKMTKKDEELRMAVQKADELKLASDEAGQKLLAADAKLAEAELKLAESKKLANVANVKDMTAKEELLSSSDREDIVKMAEDGRIDGEEACVREMAMRLYSSAKKGSFVYKIPKEDIDDKKDETPLKKAARLVNKK